MSKDHDMLDEIVARTRRIETRLTSYLISIGAHTASDHNAPTWVSNGDEGYIVLNAVDVPLAACLRAIPEGYANEVNVIFDNTIIAVLNV